MFVLGTIKGFLTFSENISFPKPFRIPPCLWISYRKYPPMPSEIHNREPLLPFGNPKSCSWYSMDIFWNRLTEDGRKILVQRMDFGTPLGTLNSTGITKFFKSIKPVSNIIKIYYFIHSVANMLNCSLLLEKNNDKKQN